MKRFTRAAAVLLLGIGAAVSNAMDASKLVDEATYAELKEKGQIQKSYYKQNNVTLTLAPDTELTKGAVSFWKNDYEPVFLVENLYLIPKKDLGDGTTGKNLIDKSSKIIRSVSRMQGMQYYSSDNKWETLYKEAYCIESENSKVRVEDDTEGSADGKVMYCMQKDNTFGKMFYRLEYHQTAEEVSAGFSTTAPIYVGFIKAIAPGDLKISVVITDCGDDVMVYMVVKAKFPAMAVLEKSMKRSFSARLDAIYKWFVESF
ncbi:MAG: hypothetical protein J5930_00400 [Treponema sp.]|nr:hypothetical protein [Treponema sp.]